MHYSESFSCRETPGTVDRGAIDNEALIMYVVYSNTGLGLIINMRYNMLGTRSRESISSPVRGLPYLLECRSRHSRR